MSSIQLTQFYRAVYRPSRRKTHCKNCWGEDFVTQKVLPAHSPRVVIEAGFGPASRSLSLCLDCAEVEAQRLEELAAQIRRAIA